MPMFAVCRRRMCAGVLCAALSAVHAQEAKTQAEAGAVADGVSSVVGIAVGAPVNPVVPVLGLLSLGEKLYTTLIYPNDEVDAQTVNDFLKTLDEELLSLVR